ncbi:hypothetical protein GMSM_43110 [Geomonas sp. Red276]
MKELCPNDSSEMLKKTVSRKVTFRGEDYDVEYVADVCEKCNLEVTSIEVAHKVQCYISDAYREKHGLLPGHQIKSLRESLNVSQSELADVMHVGVASVKRWENGLVQNKAMDRLLRQFLEKEDHCLDPYCGNRGLSLERIKLVLKEFERVLHKALLKPNDKFLYSAKYLWFADMIAYRELGRGMTGATYAALPQGPQLNNYRDLVKAIMEADVSQAEELTEGEVDIIKRVATRFRNGVEAHHASHEEPAWSTTRTGYSISYQKANTIISL